MKNQIFKTPRRGLLGSRPMGAEYMAEVNHRAKRMVAAAKVDNQVDSRQLKIPFKKS